MAEPREPAKAADGMLVFAVASAAVRSFTAAFRSTRARCNSALADCNPAISARARATSLRDEIQLAANAAAKANITSTALAQGHAGFGGAGGGAMGSGPCTGMALRT